MPLNLQRAYHFFNKNIHIWAEIVQNNKNYLNEEIKFEDLKK